MLLMPLKCQLQGVSTVMTFPICFMYLPGNFHHNLVSYHLHRAYTSPILVMFIQFIYQLSST